MVLLYDIPEHDAHPFVNLFLPHGQNWYERDGWIFADPGDFHVALLPIGPYQWVDILEANNANILVREGDLIDGWLLRIESRMAGLILEVVEADEVESFESFRQQRTALVPDLSGWADAKRVQVQTTTGHALDITHGGEHRVDREIVDYDAYPLYEAPGVDAPLGSGRVKFARGETAVEVDFDIDPDKPLLPMRVIG